MRFDVRSVAWAIYSASLLLGAQADESKTLIDKPDFSPTVLKGAPFLEQFTDDWKTRWTISSAKKDDPKSEEDWAYVGEWDVEEPYKYKGIEKDLGLVLKSPAAHHAISAMFPKKIDNKGKTLVVQYEVKLQDGLECGGAYMKLLQENKKLHQDEFSNSTPYIIMFGPDKCGTTNKVHFIIRHKNPKTGEYEEKHVQGPPPAKLGKLTNLYTLIIRADQTFEIKVNGESSKSGSLLEDMTPPINPAKEIDDPKDSKPESWVDEAKVADPEAKKPEDWDEDAPFEIPDLEATKPDDWLEDEPLMIPDPEAKKPEDWDDDEDGDWIAPKVPNPKCDEASGCGKWERPTKRNPDHKGKWAAPMIDNPLYKGEWAPKKIKNPGYFEDKKPSNLEPMGAIGFELWTMQKDILFDNIYIGHSEEEAEQLKAATFDIKHPIEELEEKAEEPKPEDTPPVDPSEPGAFKKDPIGYVKAQVALFMALASINPLQAIQRVPEVAIGVLVLTITIMALVGTLLGGPAVANTETAQKAKAKAKDAANKTKEKAKEAKDAVVDAAATGKEEIEKEVKKRATRSSTTASDE